jgi:cytochrome c peroxidase
MIDATRRVAALTLAAGALGLTAAADLSVAEVPRGLKAVKHPAENPPSDAKLALGKQLYFDGRLSRDNTISCASCHDPQKGWSNGTPFASGVGGAVGGRSSPSVLNSAYNAFQFWDGRAGSLEEQALGPIQNPIEMAMTLDEVVARLNAIEGYRTQFQAVFGTDVTAEGIARAIAAYERTVLSGDAPYDRAKGGDSAALSDAARRGMDLFFGKAQCSACHVGPNFTDNGFHNVGVGMDKPEPDVGRFAVTGQLADRGSFKTPSLRDLARTGPYMHDGSLATLEEVVIHYDKGGIANPQLDEGLFPLNLTAGEQADLVTFLKEGLTSRDYPAHQPPELPRE